MARPYHYIRKEQKQMATNEEYRQFTAFARIDGAIVGVMWIVSFICMVGEVENPLLGLAGMAFGVYSLVVAGLRLRKFRNNVLGGGITFGKAMLYSIMTFFYATLLFAMAQYVYFQFIDHGYLVNQYVALLSKPESARLATELYGMDAKQMIAILENTMGAMRPIDIAFQFLTLNVILSIFASLPIAALVRRRGA